MNIAIVSTNKHKYSETFIHNHIKMIPANIHFLFDGYLPLQYSSDKGISSRCFIKNKFNWLRKKAIDTDQSLLRSEIGKYLKKNKIDLIFCEYGPSGVEMLPVSKSAGIPMLVHFHGYDAYRDDILNSYGKNYPSLFDYAKVVISVSSHMILQLKKLGCPSEKLYLLPCGIDTDIFYLKKSITKEFTFVSCGRFVAKKAPGIILRSFAKVLKELPDVTLAMIGDGELLEESKQLAETLGIASSVSFKGALSQHQMAEVYNRSHSFIQHSVTTAQHDSEGTPLTILEAGASGLPVISTLHGGIVDIIDEEVTGFLVKEGDVDAMAERMAFLAKNPKLAETMGTKASEEVISERNLKIYTLKLWQLIDACVNKPGNS